MLIYSGNDLNTWKYFIDKMQGEVQEAALKKLYAMYNYCTGIECRHKALVNYFGQDFEKIPCDACDVCLNEVELVEDSMIIGQKILSCIKRLKENFGVDYTSKVLIGSNEQRIRQRGHDKLSTYGILREFTYGQVRNWIEQLIGQGYLIKDGEFNVLKITEKGWKLLRGEETPKLVKPSKRAKGAEKVSKVEAGSWEGVDRELFAVLRQLRRDIASQKGVPAFIVFGDVTLRDMARQKPVDIEAFRNVHGIGSHKAEEYGNAFLTAVRKFIAEHLKLTDETSPSSLKTVPQTLDTSINQHTGNDSSQPVWAPFESVDSELYDKLSELRLNFSKLKNIPAFVIFSDAALKEMALRKPTNLESFSKIKGAEKQKVEMYGRKFLEVIERHTGKNKPNQDSAKFYI